MFNQIANRFWFNLEKLSRYLVVNSSQSMGNQHNTKKNKGLDSYKIEKSHDDNDYPIGVRI